MQSRKDAVDIKSGKLFPFQFLVLAGIFLLAGLAVAIPHPIIGTILIITGAIILTADEGTEITPASNSYREYNSFLFIKTGKDKRYPQLEKIFINRAMVTQKVYTAHTMSSSTFSGVEYNAYLKFSDGVKIFLLSGKNKSRMKDRLQGVARTLNIPLQDNSL